MDDRAVERGGWRFSGALTGDGKPTIAMELFHDTVPTFPTARITFELLSGTTLVQAKTLAETMNERILGIVVVDSQH